MPEDDISFIPQSPICSTLQCFLPQMQCLTKEQPVWMSTNNVPSFVLKQIQTLKSGIDRGLIGTLRCRNRCLPQSVCWRAHGKLGHIPSPPFHYHSWQPRSIPAEEHWSPEKSRTRGPSQPSGAENMNMQTYQLRICLYMITRSPCV